MDSTATCVESSKSSCLGYLGLWSDSLCRTLLRKPASLVARRHLLQPTVRLASAKAPSVHFQTQANGMFGSPCFCQTELVFLSHTSSASCSRLCSPYRASGLNLVESTETYLTSILVLPSPPPPVPVPDSIYKHSMYYLVLPQVPASLVPILKWTHHR